MPKPPDSGGFKQATTAVVVVVTPGVLLLDLAGVAEPFRQANRLSAVARNAPPFELSVVGAGRTMPSSLPLTLSGIRPLPKRLPRGAWVVAVGVADGFGGPKAVRERAEAETVAWLARVVGPELASNRARLWTVCSGALLAARAGLLDGRQCTTHHSLIDALARACPAARVQANRIFVADGPVATSAGITAGIDLALFAVGEKLGQVAALAVARELVVYHRRAGGDPQLSPWLSHRNHLHAAVHRAQDAVLAAPAAPWSVSGLAAAAHVSPRHLARLFHDNAGIAPLDYLQQIRVELASRLLREGQLTIERVAEHAGFSSAHHLRRVWRRFHATLPSAAREGGRASG